MYYEIKIDGAKAYIYDTKGANAKVALSSSGKTSVLSYLTYDSIDNTKYKEVARVNAAVFQAESNQSTPYGTHFGWEYSDLYKTSQLSDSTADVIQFKDGSILMGDISSKDVDLSQIEWAYSGSHVILKDGKDVNIVASWRTKYTTGKYCWSWFASRSDGSYVVGAIDSNGTASTDSIRTYLKGLGCNNAIINDGGGSAELIVNGKIVNRVSERKIANGLFIYERIESNNSNNSLSDKITSLENDLKSALEKVESIKKEYL